MPRSPLLAGALRAGRWLLLLPLVLGIGLWLRAPPAADAQAPGEAVHLLTLDGVVTPTQARYLQRELRTAARSDAALVVIRLDTPGGLERAMRDMTTDILDAPVPVAVWVGPSGARAASAGLFLTVAASVASMAPGTTIGAAHPVGLGGEQDPVATDKVVADAAAYARSLAHLRGRNGDWIERAVTESIAASAEEALELGVIEHVVPSLPDLLERLDGAVVPTAAGPIALDLQGRPVLERPMVWTEQILQAVTDPNIAYILFTLGVIGLVAELYNPGTIVSGATGVTSLVLAFVAFGSLPVSGAGVALLVVGLGLLLADLYTEGLGVLAAAGLIVFVVGSLLLYQPLSTPSPALPAVAVDTWIVVAVAAVVATFFILVLRALYRARKEPVTTGAAALIGHEGLAVTDLVPEGRVRVEGEDWRAEAMDGPIDAGARVCVQQVEGVTLRVRPA